MNTMRRYVFCPEESIVAKVVDGNVSGEVRMMLERE